MKKFILLAAIAVFGFWNINAQDVKFGVKGGVNFATITGDETQGVDSRTAFHIGGVVEIGISEKFSFQPELVYSSQGAKGSDEGFDIEIKYDYLNIPLLAKFYVADGFSLEAGPQVGFLLSAKGEIQGISVDIKDFTKGIDFGLGVGGTYKLDSGLNFGARYNLGLSDINDDPEISEKNQNSVIQLSIGYFF